LLQRPRRHFQAKVHYAFTAVGDAQGQLADIVMAGTPRRCRRALDRLNARRLTGPFHVEAYAGLKPAS
jgi:hypothetical protein